MLNRHWKIILIVAIVAIFASIPLSQAQNSGTATPTAPMSGMSGMGEMETQFSADEFAPLVRGLYEGGEVLFVHTEASDPDVATVLTEMMGPQVILVPSLAEIPDELLGNVFVFTNGVPGDGPMGFQPDVFDSIPDDTEYTPLRAVSLVTWVETSTPRELNSVEDIEEAEDANEIAVESSGIVVNMPILAWPGGHR